MRAFIVLVLVAACGGHHHGAARTDDPDHLYVELAAEGSHRGALRDGASMGLGNIPFAVATGEHGDVELQLEVTKLDDVSNSTTCSVKILVLRLPQHDLLGVADASGHVGGSDGHARADCVAGVTSTLVRGKVRVLLRQRLADKR